MAEPKVLIITKKPRVDKIVDRPAEFPPLENLHLELMENKRKLKSGLPPVMTVKRTVKPLPLVTTGKLPSETQPTKEITPRNENEKKDKTRPNHKKNPSLSGSGEDIDQITIDELSSSEEKKEKRRKEEKKVKEKKVKKGKEKKSKSKKLEDSSMEELKSDVEESIGDDLAESSEESISEDSKESNEEKKDVIDDPYAGLTPEERVSREKEEYIWRFRILKKKYKHPSYEIPSYNEHSDLPTMKITYDRTVRELYLDSTVEQYRTYLMGGFLAVEYVCNQWLGIDLEGFTKQQLKLMHKYDMLLVELGEKSYERWNLNIPVELRLLGLILFNAAIFFMGKTIADKYGEEYGEMFKGITGQPPDAPTRNNRNQDDDMNDVPRKTKMRGPKIKPEDIANMK